MRNVRLALLIVAGLSLSTACSFSSSRSWGSKGANPGVGSGDNHGKPAHHSSNQGKPAKVSKSDPAPKPSEPAKAEPKEPAPAVDPAPAPATPETPTRHGREETAPAASSGSATGTITSKPGSGTPAGGTVGTTTAKPAPKGLSAAPVAPPKGNKVAAPQ